MTPPGRAKAASAIGAGVLALAAALFTTTHGDVGWDGMWMLQVIARVRGGDVLYRDVFCGVPPLTVHLGRAATAVFGIELFALRVLLVAIVVASYLVAADLLARLAGSRRYDLALVPMMFAWGLPANVPLYQPLANLFLLAAVDATMVWSCRVAEGRPSARWLLAAGAAAGFSFSAKQTLGALAIGAVAGVSGFVIARRRTAVASSLASSWLTAGLGFSAVVAAALIPVAASGGWEKFLDYGFLNKGTYVRVARVPYLEELAAFVASLRPGPAFDLLWIVKRQALLLPPAVVASMAAAWRVRARQPLAATVVAVVAATEMATLFPRADIDHVIPAVPGFLVVILFAWHAWTGPHTDSSVPGNVGTLRRWSSLAGTAVVAVVLAACAARLSASGVALVSAGRTWSSLPHLRHVLIPRTREAELSAHAAALREEARGGSLFLLVPNAGLYYLVSGVKNPTPFDYPLGTAFGRTGEDELSDAVASGRVRRLCMTPVEGTMAPERLQRAVLAGLQRRADLGPCTLYEAAR
jgi:hypothetical protein